MTKPAGSKASRHFLFLFAALLALAGCGRPDVPPDPAGGASAAPEEDLPVIVFLGDSLTAGYQLDPEQAYPALVKRRIDREGLGYRVVNAGVSGDTTADGLRRLDWVLGERVDVLVVALGANDALRGHSLDQARENLRRILARARERHPGVRLVLASMKMPANFGAAYRGDFEALYEELSRESGARLIPFLLEGVAGRPDLNLHDGIHPNPAGHRVIADNVWRHLRPVL